MVPLDCAGGAGPGGEEEALAEEAPQASLTALCALARHGDKELQPKLLAALNHLDWAV